MRLILRILPAAMLIFAGGLSAQPATELLWPGGAPGALGTDDKDKPSLTLYPVKGANNNMGTAVVVCPGGGYGALAMDHEGVQIARFLNNLGIGAFVLKYRLGPKYHHPAPLDDVHQAIRMVRTRAEELGVKPDRIGVWGFSAGGHLAATAATHFDKDTRPDFAILSYPVITFTEEAYVHKGSRKNLLGDNPDPKLMDLLSNEKQVTPQTPPTFLFHTDADTGVPAENSVLFYLALRKAKVPAEMHIFEPGKHGVGLAPKDPVLSQWAGRLTDWFRTRGLMAP